MELDDLIGQVDGEDALDRLSSAMSVKADLDELGDSLIGHFVEEARTAGCSWSEIGAAMGVSKQAAQQRHRQPFTPSEREWGWKRFGRWTGRARTVVREAHWAAMHAGHEHIGTEHLLLGMLAVPEGIAGRILHFRGLTANRVIERMAPATSFPRGRRRRHASFSPDAKKLLESAHANALRLGHNYIGTEHQLLAAFDVPDGIAAQVLAEVGITKDEVEAQVRTILEGVA